MDYKRILLPLGIIFLLLSGCTINSEKEAENDNAIEFTKVSSNEKIDQDASNRAKEVLEQNKNVKSIRAANTDKELIVAIEIPQLKRLKTAKIKKELSKKLNDEFSNLKVEVSTDQKIMLELKRLEEKLMNDAVNKKEVKKEVKRIIKLANEQT